MGVLNWFKRKTIDDEVGWETLGENILQKKIQPGIYAFKFIKDPTEGMSRSDIVKAIQTFPKLDYKPEKPASNVIRESHSDEGYVSFRLIGPVKKDYNPFEPSNFKIDIPYPSKPTLVNDLDCSELDRTYVPRNRSEQHYQLRQLMLN